MRRSWTANGTVVGAAPAHVEHVDAGLALRGAHLQLAARRLAALAPRLGLADAEDPPAVRAPARVDRERHRLAGAHRVGRRPREQRPDADPGPAAHGARPARPAPNGRRCPRGRAPRPRAGRSRAARARRRPSVPLAVALARRQREPGDLRGSPSPCAGRGCSWAALRDDAHAERHGPGDRAGDPPRPSGPAGEHGRARRGDVEPEPGLERHGAAAAAQADAHPVHALAARGRPPRSDRPSARGWSARRPPGRPWRAAGSRRRLVDDRDRHVVVPAHPYPDPADVASPVAVRRELQRRCCSDDRHLRRALEPLGDEERRERRGHEDHEDGAREEGHRRCLGRLVGAGQHHDVGSRASAAVSVSIGWSSSMDSIRPTARAEDRKPSA